MESIQIVDDEGPSNSQIVDIQEVISGIKALIEENGTEKQAIHEYLDSVQEQVEVQLKNSVTDQKKSEIEQLILKHPYFKNPCNYHIRLITIMKYLKRKGINTAIKDFDLIVDDIIAGIDGVHRLEYGRYYRKR